MRPFQLLAIDKNQLAIKSASVTARSIPFISTTIMLKTFVYGWMLMEKSIIYPISNSLSGKAIAHQPTHYR